MTERAAANHAVTLAICGWTPRLVYASCTMAGLRGVTFALRGWTPR